MHFNVIVKRCNLSTRCGTVGQARSRSVRNRKGKGSGDSIWLTGTFLRLAVRITSCATCITVLLLSSQDRATFLAEEHARLLERRNDRSTEKNRVVTVAQERKGITILAFFLTSKKIPGYPQ